MNRTFIFNGINALERFDMYIDEVQKSTPDRIEHVKELPYLSGEYDFDKVNGYPTFRPRTIVYTCQLIQKNSTQLDEVITAVNNWLMAPVEAILQDTGTPSYHFRAKCMSIVPAVSGEYGELTITFKAYPFKINNYSVRKKLWDDINFETDIMPQTDFSVTRGDRITIVNFGLNPVSLKYNSSSLINVKIDGITYALSGEGTAGFLLLPGNNELEVTLVASTITTVSFDWIEEMI